MLDTASAMTLAHLTVIGTDANAGSAHVLRSNVASLTLTDVLVQSGRGADGANGVAGSPGNSSDSVGGGVGSFWVPTQNNGAKGLKCKGVLAPDFTSGSDANQPNVEGTAAGTGVGSNGNPGSPGQGASSTPSILNGLVVWSSGADGNSDGTPGYGGSGGKTLDGLMVVGGHPYTFYAGGGGSGGCPGDGGKGGASAGGSIAILVLQGKLVISNSLIRTGDGGAGGNGGPGGEGASGGVGGVPDWNSIDRPYPPAPFAPATAFPQPCPSSGDLSVACPAYGRSGGKGGDGGKGGPGAGGWTVGILSASGASAEIDPSTQFALGMVGTGGATDDTKGPDGRKQTHFELRQTP